MAKPYAILRNPLRLSEQEIARAFHGNDNAPWYLALKQLIGDEMEAEMLAVSSAAEKDNTLLMATEAGGYAALSGLLAKVAGYVGA